MIQAIRYHDICAGHRVVGQGGKCEHLHGHNYRIHFHCVAEDQQLDDVGRVLDFGDIKTCLCHWLEDNWDHKFLVWHEDPWLTALKAIDEYGVVIVPFNPTAENMAEYLRAIVGPAQLAGTGIRLYKVIIEETRKCSASSCFQEMTDE